MYNLCYRENCMLELFLKIMNYAFKIVALPNKSYLGPCTTFKKIYQSDAQVCQHAKGGSKSFTHSAHAFRFLWINSSTNCQVQGSAFTDFNQICLLGRAVIDYLHCFSATQKYYIGHGCTLRISTTAL